jgi:hypothetical protein
MAEIRVTGEKKEGKRHVYRFLGYFSTEAEAAMAVGEAEVVQQVLSAAVPTSAHTGICWVRSADKLSGKWNARINVDGKQRHLGYYEDEAVAVAGYAAAKLAIAQGAQIPGLAPPREKSSKHIGISFKKSAGKWKAEIRVDDGKGQRGKLQRYKHIGYFATEDEAVKARAAAAADLSAGVAQPLMKSRKSSSTTQADRARALAIRQKAQTAHALATGQPIPPPPQPPLKRVKANRMRNTGNKMKQRAAKSTSMAAAKQQQPAAVVIHGQQHMASPLTLAALELAGGAQAAVHVLGTGHGGQGVPVPSSVPPPSATAAYDAPVPSPPSLPPCVPPVINVTAHHMSNHLAHHMSNLVQGVSNLPQGYI